ncbi:MAG: hypothetical protein JNM68_07890 [Dinghuibacter sp.]|nr:hypothetical protein [Dinghuibacter sp.]
MSNPTTGNSDNELNRFGWYLLIVVLIVLALVDFVEWRYERFYYYNYHSYFLGFICWFVFMMINQKIVDKNLFKRCFWISIVLFAVLMLKQLLTTFSYVAMLAGLAPVYYLVLLRVLTSVYFPGYPKSVPVIIVYSRGAKFWKGQEHGYEPTPADRKLSLLLAILTWLYFVLVVLLFATQLA